MRLTLQDFVFLDMTQYGPSKNIAFLETAFLQLFFAVFNFNEVGLEEYIVNEFKIPNL
jgi:hypothetical protein